MDKQRQDKFPLRAGRLLEKKMKTIFLMILLGAILFSGYADINSNSQSSHEREIYTSEIKRFTTGSASDAKAPTVRYTYPKNGASGLSLSMVEIAFDEAVALTTVSPDSVIVNDSKGSHILGLLSCSGATVTFIPENLKPLTRYTVTVTSDIKDLAGNAIASNYVFGFTTGAF